MTIYIDVLFTINGIINFLLLLATAKITKLKTPLWRVLLGAFAGAIYAVCIFFPKIAGLYTFASKIAFSFMLIGITFSIRKARVFLKTVCVFYITSFIFGGMALGLFYFIGFGKGTVISNGIFYFNLPWRILIISSLITYCFIRLIWKTLKSERLRDYKKIEIYSGEKMISLIALVDTGNMLVDPTTDLPVIVAELDTLSDIFPSGFNEIYKSHSADEIIVKFQNNDSVPKLRLIPFSALGTTNGVLLGFRPDKIKIEKTVTDNIIVAIYENNLSESKDYSALLNPEIISVL